MEEGKLQKVKTGVWKYFGSMFMEQKRGKEAVSLHRVIAAILFVACMVLWHMPERAVPDTMIYTLWGLLGINGVHKAAGALKSGK